MIRVRDLRVDYDDVRAVDDLSLEVLPGEVCGLIGPNGAGKTTTMRAIVGLIEPTEGTIEVEGVDMIQHPRDARKAVAFMPDFPPLYEDLKVWEFLDLFAGCYFIPRSKRREEVDRHLALVGLTEKRDAMVVGLSRGMRQRLMLAKSLIPDPKVLLLDEPASGMDPRGRIDLKNVLRELRANGKAVLVSSHVLSEMSEFCTSVAIMERGRMIVSGSIEEVRARFATEGILLVEVLGPTEEFVRILADDPLSGEPVRQEDGTFAVPYLGDAELASDLLTMLVQGGVRIARFARHKEGLEELFLKVGAKELS